MIKNDTQLTPERTPEKWEKLKTRGMVFFDHVLARCGLARINKENRVFTQEDHVRTEKEIAKQRSEAYNSVNLLDGDSERKLEADGLNPFEYSADLLSTLKDCATPAEKIAALLDHDALMYVNSVDIWYVKDPGDPKQAQEGEATYGAMYEAVKGISDMQKFPEPRDNQRIEYMFTTSDEHPGFATLRRRRELGSFTVGLPGGAKRRATVMKLMTMSSTAELAERFDGDGYVEKDKRTLQFIIDKSLPPIRQIDTVYYLVIEDIYDTDEVS